MQVFAWCQSTTTGARFSVPIERLDLLLNRGAVVEVEGRRHTVAKPPKPRRPKGAGSQIPRRRRSQ